MSDRPRPALAPVATFTAIYLVVAAFAAWRRANLEFAFYVGVMLVLVAAIYIVHRRVGLEKGTLWCLSLWGLVHMAGGLVEVPAGWPTEEPSRVLYALWLVPGWLKFDQIVHAFGFGVTTWVCWQGLRAMLGPGARPTSGALILSAAAGIGFGALNEVVEFIAVLLVPETGVGGYVNTGWDLVANLVGAGLAAAWIGFHGRRR